MPSIYRFDDLTLDTKRYSVERNGDRIDLPRLSYDLLLALVRAAPNVLTHEEIVEAVWSGRFVSPETITQRIKLLRDALGDDAAQPRYILAVRGRGYRLLPDVENVAVGTPSRNRSRRWRVAAVSFIIIAAALFTSLQFYLGSWDAPDPQRPTAQSAPSIAVLPFANLSSDPKDADFADAVHSDLLTYLSKIGSLKVISRSSVMEYQEGSKNLREVGSELGVTSILEGTVQRVDDVVRINVQLIDAETDGYLWAQTYDRALTAESIFSIQNEIAVSVAKALEATLSPQVVARLSEVPTQNLLAYNFYLSGNDYARRSDNLSAYSLAAQQYQRAVEEDPEFALAWAALSRAHSGMYFFRVDPTESRRALAREAVERAFHLAPDLPEAHLAMGEYHYHGYLDYERALQELAIAEAGMPGDSRISQARAYIYRRMGQFERSVVSGDRTLELDPRNIQQLLTQADSYTRLRDYEGAEQYVERAREFAPDSANALLVEAMLPLYRDGDVTSVRAHVESSRLELGPFQHRAGWTAAIFGRNYKQALRYLDDWQVEVDVADDDGVGRAHVPIASYYGTTYRLAGQPLVAMGHFKVARVHLEGVLERDPGDPFGQLALAEATAGLGDNESAIRLAHQVTESFPRGKDQVMGQDLRLEAVMRVFVPAGEYDAAIEHLEDYLAKPGVWSIEGLLRDPRLDPVRDDPRFQALVEKHSRQ